MKMSKGARKRRLRAKAHQELLGAAPLVVGLDLAQVRQFEAGEIFFAGHSRRFPL